MVTKKKLPIRIFTNLGEKLTFKQMTERPMTNIMQKSYKNWWGNRMMYRISITRSEFIGKTISIPASFTVWISNLSMPSSMPYKYHMGPQETIKILKVPFILVKYMKKKVLYLIFCNLFYRYTSKPVNTKRMLKSRVHCPRVHHICQTWNIEHIIKSCYSLKTESSKADGEWSNKQHWS